MTTDHLDSTRVVTNQNKGVVARHDYLPFGEEIPAGEGVNRTTALGYVTTDDTTQRFTSKESDNESGLDYFGARYYSSAQGRFSSPDEFFKDSRPAAPQTWDKYSYVRNNPLSLIDPRGEEATVRIEGDAQRGTGIIDISASFVIYPADPSVSEQDLRAQADALKRGIESAYSGSFTDENGITFKVVAHIDVKVVGTEAEAEERGQMGRAQNLVAVTSDKSLLTLTGDGQSRAWTYRVDGEKFDRITIAGKNPDLVKFNTYAHEFGHSLGLDEHLKGEGNIMSSGAVRKELQHISRKDFKNIFGQVIEAHSAARTEHHKFVFGRGGAYDVPRYGSLPPPTTHEMRAGAVIQ